VLVFAFDENDAITMSVKLSDYGMAVGCYHCTHVSLASGDKPIRYMPDGGAAKGQVLTLDELKDRVPK
jgi:hypothetical protein